MTRVAAVDVGTNSVRLLVADGDDGALRPVERLMTITRLGKGVDARGHLDDDALHRTLDCISSYAARWQELGAKRVRVTATSAVRDAVDRERFFNGVHERAGVQAEVLTGEDEARTAFLGATAAVDATAPYLVLDIGGGSTELIVGSHGPEAMTSRQLGCVRLTERCLTTDPPTPAQLDAAIAVVDAELDAADRVVDAAAATTLIGVAGTVTTVAALYLQLEEYQADAIHGTWVPLPDVVSVTRRLAGMPAAQRRTLGPMAPGREDVIVGGCLILQRVMQRYGFDEVLVSESDILDGLALDLLAG
jgi:exopolyphosphatase / guanosine-5'-triphosphate,3'-diphosphate pyrophosphatase